MPPRQQKRDHSQAGNDTGDGDLRTPERWRVGGNDGSNPNSKHRDRDRAEDDQPQRADTFEASRASTDRTRRARRAGRPRTACSADPPLESGANHSRYRSSIDAMPESIGTATRRSDVTGSVNSRRGKRPSPRPSLRLGVVEDCQRGAGTQAIASRIVSGDESSLAPRFRKNRRDGQQRSARRSRRRSIGVAARSPTAAQWSAISCQCVAWATKISSSDATVSSTSGGAEMLGHGAPRESCRRRR